MEMPSNNPQKNAPSKVKSWLPSKKVGWTLIALIVLIVLAIFGSKLLSLIQKRQQEKQQAIQAVAVTQRDTDGDGVPDWQEVLFRLDPEKKDTDGDGIDDKKAFESLRAMAEDPTEIDRRLAAATDEDKISLILSDKIGKAIVAGKSEDEIQAIIADTIREYAQSQVPVSDTELAAHMTVVDETTDSITTYFKAVAPHITETTSVLQDAAQYITPTSIKVPDTYLARITALADVIKETPVPSSLVSLQSGLVSSLYQFRDGLTTPVDIKEGDELNAYVQTLIIQALGDRVTSAANAYVRTFESIYPKR